MSSVAPSASLQCLKLKDIIDDGHTNNYNEFSHKAELEFHAMGYWKYIKGPLSMPPSIPQLR